MTDSEQIVAVLQAHQGDDISIVEVKPYGSVFSKLKNRIDAKQPYNLVFEPTDAEDRGLRIVVYPFLEIAEDSEVFRKLLILNPGLSGCLCNSPPDGGLLFKIEHVYENGEGPSNAFLEQLLHDCLFDVRFIEDILLFETMVETGVPEEKAQLFVNRGLGDDAEFSLGIWNQHTRENKLSESKPIYISEGFVEVLLNHGETESISNVQIQSDGAVSAQLENWINVRQPYRLVVCADEQRLHVYVYLLSFPEHSGIFRKLLILNLGLGCGCLCVIPHDGRVFFKFQHVYENSGNPDPEFFRWVLNEYIKGIRVVERILWFETMAEAGIPKERAEQFVKSVFGDSQKHILAGWDLLV